MAREQFRSLLFGKPCQDLLECASFLQLDRERYHSVLEYARSIGRDREIDERFKEDGINVLVGPAENSIPLFAAAITPVATLLLVYLEFNGRPHALAAIAAAHQEDTMTQWQSAWEATFPAKKASTFEAEQNDDS